MNQPSEFVLDTSILSRLDLLPILMDTAMKCLKHFGVDGAGGPATLVDIAPIDISLRPPKTLGPGAIGKFGLGVWYYGRKGLSVCWNSEVLRDYELVTLKRGPWIAELLALAAQIRPSIE